MMINTEQQWKIIEEAARLSALSCIRDAEALEKKLMHKRLKRLERIELTIEALKEDMQICSKLKQKNLFLSIKEILKIVLSI